MRKYQELAMEIVRRREAGADAADAADAAAWRRKFQDRLARLPPVGRTTKLPEQLARPRWPGPLFRVPADIQQQLRALVNDETTTV